MFDAKIWPVMVSGRIDPRGWIFIGIGLGISALIFLVSLKLALFCALVTLGVALFFRDPSRSIPTRPEVLVAPADGLILDISEVVPPEELDLGGTRWTKISIFLNLWDVHVNRMPLEGKVLQVAHTPGKFLEAFKSEASLENERCGVVIQAVEGFQIACVQIAGYIARRIVCEAKPDQTVQKGQRYGIICFGSRVDLYLPTEYVDVWATLHQRTIAGETVLGVIRKPEQNADANWVLESEEV